MSATQAPLTSHAGTMRPGEIIRGVAGLAAAVASEVITPWLCRRRGHQPITGYGIIRCHRCHKHAVSAGTGIRWVA